MANRPTQEEMETNMMPGGKMVSKNLMGREEVLKRTASKSPQPPKLGKKEVEAKLKKYMSAKGMLK